MLSKKEKFMEYLSNFPERLRELMFDRGEMKSEELGAAIGVHGTNVRAWLNGTSLITLENAIKLANFFLCSLDYLSGRKEQDEEVLPRPLPPFYENLRKVMAEKQVTRYRIVRDTDIRDLYFTKWRKGAKPDLITVIKLADRLEVSLDYLVGRTDY